MPHRVANFLRASTSTLESQIFKKSSDKNGTTQPRRQKSPSSRPSRSSERVFSYESSTTEDGADESHASAAKMTPDRHESPAETHHHHRLSFPGFGHLGRGSKEAPSSHGASLDLVVESPPIVFHGDVETSTGALVSGQLLLQVKEDGLPLESFNATLSIHVTQKKPFTPHCHDCTHQYTELQSWSFLKAPLAMTKGMHQFPFSVLLGGHLPATLDNPLMSISYEFKAEVVPKAGHGPSMKLDKVFEVKRSLPTHETPHHSLRVFPPTNIKASVHFPQVIHPTGANTLTLRLDGIARPNEKNDTVEFWKLKKLTWRIEEKAKTVAPACEKHAPREFDAAAAAAGGPQPKKGFQRNDMRVIGEKTLFSGWKSNYDSTEDASVDLELEYGVGKNFGLDPESGPKDKRRHACDGRSADGSEVTHQLMVEMVVSQEWAPAGRPALVTQTGVGRILRMHFATLVTERGGLGISWDNEAPPVYQDVPPSPPAYAGGLVGHGTLEEFEFPMLTEADAPPRWSPSPVASPVLDGPRPEFP
ncbi:hypothetical protein RB594_001294 [Gaeumannomyces avenae]